MPRAGGGQYCGKWDSRDGTPNPVAVPGDRKGADRMGARAARRRTIPFYAPRRVPQSFPPSYLRARIGPLVPGLIGNVLLTGITSAPGMPAEIRQAAKERSEEEGAHVLEVAQQIFFDEPGLDTLLVRSISRVSRKITNLGRAYLHTRIALHLDHSGRASQMLHLVPRRGYDSLMTMWLAVGTALGTFRGGEVHARAFHDSGVPAPQGPTLALPEGHPTPQVRRLDAPRSLGDMAADIDDLYWAMAWGQPVKITRVGQGEHRRWLVSLPGTDHMLGDTTPNPADIETNIREVLNVPSAMRVGLVKALHQAMRADGVPRERWALEPVLMCGHSQAGIVATALAAARPEDVGVNVRGVLALGSPSRRFVIRDDVTMVSVVHDQDVIPSTDGTPQRARDHRVIVGRRLVRPRQGALYYAHSSTTYTETVRQVERKTRVAPWGRVPEAIHALQAFLPGEAEPVRVWLHDIWQDVLEPTPRDRWDTYIALDRPDWEPADYEEDWAPAPLVSLPPVELPDLSEIQERATHVVEEWTQGVASRTDELRSAVDETLRRIVPGAVTRGAGGGMDEGGHALVDGQTTEGIPAGGSGPEERRAAGSADGEES